MTSIDPALLARLTTLGFVVGVVVLHALTMWVKTDRFQRRYQFKETATRQDIAREYIDYMNRIFFGKPRETMFYTLGWGAAGALLFALGTLLVAGIGAVFL